MAKPDPLRLRHQLEAERARRDAHWFLFESGFVRTKDEHDAQTPVKPFPDVLYLRALLDLLLVSGRLLPAEQAHWAAEAGCEAAWIQHLAQTGILLLEKSRQMLVTWLIAAYCLWRARALPHQLILVQSKREEDAAAIVFTKAPGVGRMSFMEDQLPRHLRMTTWPQSGTHGRLFLQHPGGAISQVWAIPEGGDVIRSNTPSVVFADEAAYQAEFGASYTAALPAVHGGGQYVAVSSAEPGEFAALVGAEA